MDRSSTTGALRRASRFVPLAVVVLVALGLSGARCKRKMKKLDEYNRELWTAEADENLDRIYQAMERLWKEAKVKDGFEFPSAGPTPPRVPCGRRAHKPDPGLWAELGSLGVLLPQSALSIPGVRSGAPPVPEPSTWVLLATGGVLLLFWRLRRRPAA